MLVTHDEFNDTSDIQSWLILTALVTSWFSWGDEVIFGKKKCKCKMFFFKKTQTFWVYDPLSGSSGVSIC